MGKSLLILLVGFAASFGILAQSKNRRLVESVDRMADQFASYSAQNTASSGAYVALNQLYQNPAWRGTSNFVIGGNALTVTVKNDSLNGTLLPHRVKILSNAGNADASDLAQVVIFDRGFQHFAVWAKDTVIDAITYDSLGVANSDLLVQNAPFMPNIDKTGLLNAAVAQGQVASEDADGELLEILGNGHFHPSSGFPNNSFYHDSTAAPKVANVIHVQGDLHVRDGRTVYGIYIVEGDVMLNENAKVRGVLYLPNPSSKVYNREDATSQITGGIVTWGTIDGDGYKIIVKHKPEYLNALVSKYASDNPPLRVLTWK